MPAESAANRPCSQACSLNAVEEEFEVISWTGEGDRGSWELKSILEKDAKDETA